MSNENNMTATVTAHDDKGNISHVEAPDHDEINKPASGEKLDEFGASAKTDPKEIALVRKLDFHMMVSAVIGLG